LRRGSMRARYREAARSFADALRESMGIREAELWRVRGPLTLDISISGTNPQLSNPFPFALKRGREESVVRLIYAIKVVEWEGRKYLAPEYKRFDVYRLLQGLRTSPGTIVYLKHVVWGPRYRFKVGHYEAWFVAMPVGRREVAIPGSPEPLKVIAENLVPLPPVPAGEFERLRARLESKGYAPEHPTYGESVGPEVVVPLVWYIENELRHPLRL